MYYGIQLAVSGILTSMYRTDVLANNLANANTVGFKPQKVMPKQRDAAAIEDALPHLPSNTLLERLGGGVHNARNRLDFTQGALQETGNPLDIAIDGDGFLMIRDISDGSSDAIRLTRDGRLERDGNGRLVHVGTGLPVLNTNGEIIRLREDSTVRIDGDGTIRQGDAIAGRLEFIDVRDKTQLTPSGAGLFQPTAAALEDLRPATGKVRQGFVEAAAVNPISAMLALQGAARSTSGNVTLVQYQDRMIDSAINRFGRSS